jgi:hypothetical protein
VNPSEAIRVLFLEKRINILRNRPFIAGCWGQIFNLSEEEIDRVKLLNNGLAHYSKK